MRTVFTNREIPHLWMHKTQPHARNANGSFYFNGDIIYSWGSHFPIARHVTNANGQDAILFNARGYSQSTSQHKSLVRRSIPSSATVFKVPVLTTRWNLILESYDHKRNLEHYKDNFTIALNKAARARLQGMKDHWVSEAHSFRSGAIEYAKFFDLPVPEIDEIPADFADIKKAIAEDAARKAKETKKEESRLAEKYREEILAWLNGENADYYAISRADTMLRVVGDEVETSRGATFPIEHARKGLALVRAVMARGEEWKANGHTCHLGHYQIDKITANGTVYAGCHVVTWKEIERIAPILERKEETNEEKNTLSTGVVG